MPVVKTPSAACAGATACHRTPESLSIISPLFSDKRICRYEMSSPQDRRQTSGVHGPSSWICIRQSVFQLSILSRQVTSPSRRLVGKLHLEFSCFSKSCQIQVQPGAAWLRPSFLRPPTSGTAQDGPDAFPAHYGLMKDKNSSGATCSCSVRLQLLSKRFTRASARPKLRSARELPLGACCTSHASAARHRPNARIPENPSG